MTTTIKDRSYVKTIITGIYCLFQWACIQEIPFENKSNLSRINISGQFTDVLEEQTVEIRKVANLTAESAVIGDPIENAQVDVYDNTGKNLRFSYKGAGKYAAMGQGALDKSYKLKVTTTDGKVYETSLIKMKKNASIDSLKTELYNEGIINTNGTVTIDKRVALSISTKLNNGSEPINTLYRITGEYEFQEEDNRIAPLRVCFIKQNFDYGNIVALSGSELPNNYIVSRRIFTVSHDYRFSYMFCFHVDQFSVDQTTFEYWNGVQKATNLKRSVFDPPPGRLYSNITCTTDPNEIVFGYFTIATKVTKRIFTNSLKLGTNGQYYCRGGSISRRPPECVDCRLLQGSSTERPSYWPF